MKSFAFIYCIPFNYLYVNGVFSGTADGATALNRLAGYNTANNTWLTSTTGDADLRNAALATRAGGSLGQQFACRRSFTGTGSEVALYFTRIYLHYWKVPAGSADWFTDTNWTTETVPTANTNIVIPAGAGQISIASANVTRRDLVPSGGTI